MLNNINQKSIKISVCVVTYNQKKYLKECLTGLVKQDISCKYEIIIGDDASTDGTDEFIIEFSKTYPDLIIPVIHKNNIGPYKNYLFIHSMARGQYVCHMDGDDIAFSEKLKMQSSYLDNNRNHQFVWHRMEIFDDERQTVKYSHEKINSNVNNDNITQADLLTYGSIGFHSSMMYRRDENSKKIFDYLITNNLNFIDYFIAVQFLADGKLAANLHTVLGGYRYNLNQQTLSKPKSGIFKKNPTKILLANHLKYFLELYPERKKEIFVCCITNTLADMKNLRRTTVDFGMLAWNSCSLKGVYFFTKKMKNLLKFRTK